jgi:hypothetical protein
MTSSQKIAQIRKLQSDIDELRSSVQISSPGVVLYLAERIASHEHVVVTADGYDGANLSIVEGNYPLDYVTNFEKDFETEEAAIEHAATIE